MSLKTTMIAASLALVGAIGGPGTGDMRQAEAASNGYEPRQPKGSHRYRGTPYSASPEAKAERFRKCKRGCRPPARRHYGPGRGALDAPKRLRDWRAWFKSRF